MEKNIVFIAGFSFPCGLCQEEKERAADGGVGRRNTEPGVGPGSSGEEWIRHHNDQAKYLSSPYSESIMKSFYRGHHWNLDTDLFFFALFTRESRFHSALLFPLRLPRSLVAQSKFNTEPCVRNKNELWLCLTDDT